MIEEERKGHSKTTKCHEDSKERLLSARKSLWNSLSLEENNFQIHLATPSGARLPPVLRRTSATTSTQSSTGKPNYLPNIEIRLCFFLAWNLLTSSHFRVKCKDLPRFCKACGISALPVQSLTTTPVSTSLQPQCFLSVPSTQTLTSP